MAGLPHQSSSESTQHQTRVHFIQAIWFLLTGLTGLFTGSLLFLLELSPVGFALTLLTGLVIAAGTTTLGVLAPKMIKQPARVTVRHR